MSRRFLSVLCVLALASCAPLSIHDHRPDNKVTTTPPASKMAKPTPVAPGAAPREALNLQELPVAPVRMSKDTPIIKVGILLPLSGPSKELGQSMLDAATLALYDAYVSLPPERVTAKVTLIPKDTAGSPTAAASAAKQVIAQGADLIIGPLFSQSVSAIAPITRAAGVPVLSFSNNKTIAGRGVYVLGFLPEQQVKRVGDYAVMKGVTTLGAMLPNDAYGRTVSDALLATLRTQGVRVEPLEMYARAPANLKAAAFRVKEGYGRTPFQALMLAEGGQPLKDALQALHEQGMDQVKVQLMGTGLWDDEAVLANPALNGAWFASAPPQYYASFAKRFIAVYNRPPQRLAALAYDAVSLAATIGLQAGAPDFSEATLTAREGFVGPANGLYRLNSDGTSERPLSVMQIDNGGVIPLEPAPIAFDNK